MTATYDPGTNTIVLSSGENTPATIYTDVYNDLVFSYNINTVTSILSANLTIEPSVSLIITNEIFKFNGAYTITNHGTLDIDNSTITSVNTSAKGNIKSVKKQWASRSYTFRLTRSILSYLAPTTTNTWGIQTLITEGSAEVPAIVTDNDFSHMDGALRLQTGYIDTIKNNVFHDMNTNDVVDIGNGLFENNTLRNLTSNYCVVTWGSGQAINNTFDTVTYLPGAVGIRVKEGSGGAIIKGNIFKNGLGGMTHISVVGSNHSRWTYIEDNIIQNSDSQIGIKAEPNGYLGGYDVYAVIRNNVISGGEAGIYYTAIPYFGSPGNGARHMRMYNNTVSGANYNIMIDGVNQIDSIAYDNDVEYIQYGHYYTVDTVTPKFINTKYSTLNIGSGRFYDYKLLDVKVIDMNGKAINNTTVIITNDIDVNYPSINIEGQTKTSFITKADGHTPLPSNDMLNSIAILDFYKTPITQQEMSYTITATYNEFSNSITVNPDTTWYRAIPDTYQNTIIIQLQVDILLGNIIGKVVDNHDNPISNVSATNSNGFSAITDTLGNYEISSLTPGNYTLTISKMGYIIQTYNYNIISTETVIKDFTLLQCPFPICNIDITQI